MSNHEPQAMLASNAQSNALSKSTYVRTYLRRTTHLGSYLTLGIARRGVARFRQLGDENSRPAALRASSNGARHA
ncbi:hypothetical protein SEA_PIPER2020_89 [Mycobacterium phage Piper2020]|nr:hypothetical protein SEA_PIPER2020_89 [Mycobacterium phage Piper2020]